MEIKSARYDSSAISVDKCIQTDKPEFAFIGRSNVGKSSLINMLTGNQKLAMTSSTPGKTILINHFLINGEWYLVDLPGYGYAKRSKKQQEQLGKMIRGYIMERQNMVNLFLLIDGNIAPQQIDLQFIEWLGENGVPFTIIFTKADKSRKGSFGKNVSVFLKTLEEQWEELPPYFQVSSAKRIGKEAVLEHIETILQSLQDG
ncbi:MAG: YihA family ribosome biogenesis GTP-binding protein [Bacteroidaceae bacterium]|nr:YihA family ribosome biogenesis GTP-binding protein [Bacteroidaceae bacterium]MBR3733872.1 YihA family ribosome biogenesis GTP-binding protein [Bacteroidaceae bacterium]